MITILFFIFIALVVFHFIYDGILAPSLRYEIRLNLFGLRDQLRMLKIENPKLVSDELFCELQEDLNGSLRLVNKLTIYNSYKALSVLKEMKEITRRVEYVERLVEESSLAEIKQIHNGNAIQLLLSFVANAGGWVIYLLPFFILFLSGVLALKRIKRLAFKIVKVPDDKFSSRGFQTI